ncbi:MAG: hypothetical protein CK426_06930 [Legionella sp.]|nr:MAG: hypothetical protein CK423_02790 [Legionella sp.]PJD98075.1 MAG: hypothetical protein CK426_06930 [Legionella sp.]
MSFLSGLLLGCIIGVVGYYSIHRYFTQDQEEGVNSQEEDILSLFNDFPQEMQVLCAMLFMPEHQNIREFFVVDPSAIMNSATPRLRFNLSEGLLHLIARLEEWGCIEQLEHDSLLYKIEEDFFEDLMALHQQQAVKDESVSTPEINCRISVAEQSA